MPEFKMEFGFGKRKTFVVKFDAASLKEAYKKAEEPSGKLLKHLEEVFVQNKFSIDEGWHNYEVLGIEEVQFFRESGGLGKKKNQLTKDETICLLAANDIVSIIESASNKDYEYIFAALTGDCFTQYNNMTKKQLASEFKEQWSSIKTNTEVLALAHVLNGEPIDLLKYQIV